MVITWQGIAALVAAGLAIGAGFSTHLRLMFRAELGEFLQKLDERYVTKENYHLIHTELDRRLRALEPRNE